MSIETWHLREGDFIIIEHPTHGNPKRVKLSCNPYYSGGLLWVNYGAYITYFSEKQSKWFSIF